MKKVNIGIIGLGRLGIQHAENIAFKVPNCKLQAICALDEEQIKELQERWNVPEGYTTFDEMIKSDTLDAIFIASPSHLHTVQIEKALDAGFHVFSEKPLGTSLKECKQAEQAVEKHPDKIFMLGFMRRYDPSYQYAKEKIDNGEIGQPILYRGYSVDPESEIEGAIKFAAHSGGQFIDMAVHDIDLARWFLDSEAKTVYAIGGCYAHPEFGQYDDGDNVSALMKFENDTMAFLYAGRTAPHGYNVETEIVGTKGTLRIGSVPQKNLVEILDEHGVRKECSQGFLERFEKAYEKELEVFVQCIIDHKKPEVTVYDGTKSTITAYAATESFQSGTLVQVNTNQ